MFFRARNIFERRMTPNVIFSVDQMNISYALASSGIGACFVTDTLFKYGNFHDNVYLYKVGSDTSRTLYIAHKKSKYVTCAMQEFIRIAREEIK